MQSTTVFKGKWWLSDKEDDKVSGVLTYIQGETLELELIGNFRDSAQDALSLTFQDGRTSVIFGQASDGSNISLFDCGCYIHRTYIADFPIVKYTPRAIAVGIHIADINEKRFFKAIVKIPELSYWLFPEIIEQKYFFENDDVKSVNVKMDKLTETERTAAKTSLNSGFTFSLTRDAHFDNSGSMFSARFEQFTSLKIESKSDSSIKGFYEKAVRFERFLSLATFRDVAYSELSLYSNDCCKTIGKDRVKYDPIRIDTIFHKSPCEKKIESINFLFNYDDIKDKYNYAIKRWFSKDKQFDAIRGHMLESIDYKGHFSYMNFLIVIQAIEGYGWRYRKSECKVTADNRYAHALKNGKKNEINRIILNDILTTLISEYNDISCINKNIKIAAAVDSRHYYSHLTEKPKKNKLEGIKLFELTQDLRRLLFCCVMTYLGFSNTEIQKFTSGTNNIAFRGK